MIRRLIMLCTAALLVASCGVKSQLDLPNGKHNAKNQQDPSNPPNPLGGGG